MPLAVIVDPRPPLLLVAPPPRDDPAQEPLPLADDALTMPPPTSTDDVAPQLRAAAAGLVRLILEGLAGARPLGPLERLTSTQALTVVARGARHRHRLLPRSLTLAQPSPGVLEVALRAHDPASGSDVAAAFCLRQRGGRLVCTALDLGPRVASAWDHPERIPSRPTTRA